MVNLRLLKGSLDPLDKRGSKRKHSSHPDVGASFRLIDCRPDLYESLRSADRPKAIKRIGAAVVYVAAVGLALFLAF